MTPSQRFNFTLFPPVPLREDEEGNVESLDHYLSRLGGYLGMSVFAVTRLIANCPVTAGPMFRDLRNRNALIGPGPRTEGCVSSVSAATGVPDLYRGSFLNLSPALTGIGFANCNNSASARKWCPRCYLEWDDDYSFEPLYWAFGALTVCPIHRCQMVSRCARCGSKQNHGAKYSKRRKCRSCLQTLGSQTQVIDVDHYEDWVNLQCVLTARVASTTEAPLRADTFDRYFQRVLARWQEGEPISGYVKASMLNLELRWKKGDRQLKPTMTQYLNFASFHGTSVEEILLSPESAAAEPLIEGARRSFTHFSLRRPLKRTLESLKLAMERLVESDIALLPSASAITSAFEVDLSYVRERMRDVVEKYSTAREQSGKRYSKQELRRAFCCAVSLIRDQGKDTDLFSHDELVTRVAAAARCSEDVAKCATRAGFIAVSS